MTEKDVIKPTTFVGSHIGTQPFCLLIAIKIISGKETNMDQIAPLVVARLHRTPRYRAGSHAPNAAVEKRKAYMIVAVPIAELRDPKYTITAMTMTHALETNSSLLSSISG